MAHHVICRRTATIENGKLQPHVFICSFPDTMLAMAHYQIAKWLVSPTLPFDKKCARVMAMEANIKCGIDPPLLRTYDEKHCEGK